MMMHDYKRALYDFSAAFFNQDRLPTKQPPPGQIKHEQGGAALFYMHAGQCNYYLGQYEEALAHYDIARARDGDSGPLKSAIYYNKGLANASLGRYPEAIDDYVESIKDTEPAKQAQAQFQLGATLRKIANLGIPDRHGRGPEQLLKDSVAALTTAVQHAGTEPSFHNNLGLS